MPLSQPHCCSKSLIPVTRDTTTNGVCFSLHLLFRIQAFPWKCGFMISERILLLKSNKNLSHAKKPTIPKSRATESLSPDFSVVCLSVVQFECRQQSDCL